MIWEGKKKLGSTAGEGGGGGREEIIRERKRNLFETTIRNANS